MKSEETGMVHERAGSSVRIEHRPSKPLLETGAVRGEGGANEAPFAHRLPPNPWVPEFGPFAGIDFSPHGPRRARGDRDRNFLSLLALKKRAGELAAYRTWFLSRTRRTATGCLEWLGGRGGPKRPWGVLSFGTGPKNRVPAHRAAWMLFVGPISKRYPLIRHLCHNHPCVNWEHLEPGTDAENFADNAFKPTMAPRRRDLTAILGALGGGR